MFAFLLAGVAFWGYHMVSTLLVLDAACARTVYVDASGQVTRTFEPDSGTIEKVRQLWLLLGFALGCMAATAIYLLVDRAIDYWAIRREVKRQDDFLREMRPPGTPAGQSG
jgi:hypothetical protein